MKNKTAEKLSKLAGAMDNQIHAKMTPAIGEQNVTRRRAMIAEGMRKEGLRLKRVQSLLMTLAACHEAGNVPAELQHITSKKAAEDLFIYGKGEPAYDIAEKLVSGCIDEKDIKAEKIKKLEASLIGSSIPGFFPTPAAVIGTMLDLIDVEPGMKYLEPSAGKGDIAEALSRLL